MRVWRTKQRVLVLVTAGLVGLVAAAGLAATTESHRFRIEVRVLGDHFELGEPVPFEVLACSTSYAPMWQTVPDEDAMWAIREAGSIGNEVAISHHYQRSEDTKRVFWWPRTCRRVAADVWDQAEWNVNPAWDPQRTGRIVKGSSIPPGSYVVDATWAGLQSENRAEFSIVP